MYICSNNYIFEIKPIQENIAIYIEKKQNETYLLCVPASMPEEQLVQLLKSKSKQLVKLFEERLERHKNIHLRLYNRNYRYQFTPNAISSYKSNNSIYSARVPKSPGSLNKILNDILLHDIKQFIAIWEERLGVIVETINLKNYKTKAFHICHNLKAIYFAQNLINQNFDYIDFIVAKALFEHLTLTEDQQVLLLERYVQNWKNSLRIYDFERNGKG